MNEEEVMELSKRYRGLVDRKRIALSLGITKKSVGEALRGKGGSEVSHSTQKKVLKAARAQMIAVYRDLNHTLMHKTSY